MREVLGSILGSSDTVSLMACHCCDVSVLPRCSAEEMDPTLVTRFAVIPRVKEESIFLSQNQFFEFEYFKMLLSKNSECLLR